MGVPADFTVDTSKAPRGVSGQHRINYLSLNNEQRRIYRYWFDKCGKPAFLAYRYATEGEGS